MLNHVADQPVGADITSLSWYRDLFIFNKHSAWTGGYVSASFFDKPIT